MGNSRTMKRQAERQKKKDNTKYWVTKEEILQTSNSIFKDMFDKERQETRKKMNNVIGAFFMALHDEFGFSNKRLNRQFEKTKSILDSIYDGDITGQDVADWLEDKDINYKIMTNDEREDG
jgi:hypothetical protein